MADQGGDVLAFAHIRAQAPEQAARHQLAAPRMAARGDPPVLFPGRRGLADVVQHGRPEHDAPCLRIQAAPAGIGDERLHHHGRVHPDVAFAVMDRVLRAAFERPDLFEPFADAVPVETPLGRLRYQGVEHRGHAPCAKMSTPGMRPFWMIGRSSQWVSDWTTLVRKLWRTNFARPRTRASSSSLM